MHERRVAITGLGIVCALGENLGECWSALSAGRPAISRIASLDISQLRFENGAEARGYAPEKHFEPGRIEQLDRFTQFALVAAREALGSAHLELTPDLRERSAVITASAMGGQSTQDAVFQDLYKNGRGRAHPLSIPRTMANAGASLISMEFGLTGPAFTLSTACASSNHALGLAFRMIRAGEVDVALAGGSEAPFSFGMLKAWESMRVIAPDTCRPFSRDRRGMILGEGGAMLVLEPLEAARARGATIHAEIIGFGMSSDAHHITQPTVEGPVRALRAALADASLRPEQVAYINAHGTGTLGNDPTETRAIRQVFGTHTDRIAVSSTKSMHGHALGAAGALEAVATVMALRHKILPPTANFIAPDPECNLDVIPNSPRRGEVEFALSNSFAFGGLNAVLAFRAY